ncbi:hypothetical protein M422DRAFT_248959 [Sphaerobolus stellatus SS14]|nr:hypothetical protein M422DRAFT_248948 [Sphaerobolus stellatus SS14]KIJ47532.1 hypothetical protein M422DRAFT_248959 [Sphaerobolus stellatus SS14]
MLVDTSPKPVMSVTLLKKNYFKRGPTTVASGMKWMISKRENPGVGDSTLGDRAITVTSPTNAYLSDIGPHPLASPETQTYSRKRPRKLIEDSSFRNHVLIYDERPEYWSLHMWNTLKHWHTNPMSIPNIIRDDSEGYFLEEDVDVTAWISKVLSDITRPIFMHQMKVVFGSRLNFETAFSGFPADLLKPNHQGQMWLTDYSTPLRVGSQIIKGRPDKSQMPASVKLPKGPDFLVLVLKHCSLTKEQIYNKIIPTWKGMKKSGPSRLSVHAPTPAKTGESSQQRLDADLDSYHQVHEPVLPYDEVPPSGTPNVEMDVRTISGTSSTLPNESTMNVDQELDDLYQ